MKNKQEMIDSYTITGLWLTMSASLCLMGVKGVLSQNYLIHFYVDSLVSIVAFYIMIHNLKKQYDLLKDKKPFIVQLVTLIVALVLVVLTYYSPFDFSFLILVIGMIINRKMFLKQL